MLHNSRQCTEWMAKPPEPNTRRTEEITVKPLWPGNTVQGFVSWTFKEKTSERMKRTAEWRQETRTMFTESCVY